MSTFLIFGATGQIGRFLLPRLAATGAQVCAFSRNPPAATQQAAAPQATASHITWIRGNLNATVEALPPVEIICSLGPLDMFADWFERYPGTGTRRVIAFSSMSAESKRESMDADERALARRLTNAETRIASIAQTRGIAWTLFRPTLIYGAGIDRSLAPIARFARRWRILPVPIGANGLRQPVHAADLAQACMAVLDCPAACGKTYALGGGERLRFDAMLRRLRAALPWYTLTLPVPMVALRVALPLFARIGGRGGKVAALQRLRQPLIADNSSAQHDFGFAPRGFIATDAAADASA